MSRRCPDCGNNPTSHILLYIAQTVVFITAYIPLPRTGKVGSSISAITERFAEYLRLTRWKRSLSTNSPRTRVIIKAAKERGIKLEQEYALGTPTDIFRFKKDERHHRFYSLPEKSSHDARMRTQLDNKWLTKKLLNSLSTRTPAGVLVTSPNHSGRCNGLRYPLVVKPAQGSRGRHTTMYVRSEVELKEAIRVAKRVGYFVVCEEQYKGSVYRFTTVDGKVAAVLRGDYPSVVGNGRNSLAELIEKKNARRPSGVSEAIIDKGLIARQGATTLSILAKGHTVHLNSKIGVRYGGDAVEVTPLVHHSFKKEIERVAMATGQFVLGFDVIAEDISRPRESQQWTIIEVNTIPFIDLHHFPRSGEAVDVAGIVWDTIYSS